MTRELDQLERESAMLLYAADELPPAERAIFEARLAAEPELADELRRWREAERACFAALGAADQRERLPVSEGVAIRRAGRAMQQWLVDRAAVGVPQPRRRRFPWWAYPSAAAAVLLVGFLVWSSNRPVGPIPANNEFLQYAMEQQTALAEWMSGSLRSRADAMADAEFLSPQVPELEGLDEVFLREEWIP